MSVRAAKYLIIGLLGFFIAERSLNAQPIDLRASSMKNMEINGENIQVLTGGVTFIQNGNTVSCDRAEFNSRTDELRGLGSVVINSSDGVTVTGESLLYSNASKNARVDGNVVLRDGTMTLTTPSLNYSTTSRIGWYSAGGKIVDDQQVLTSGSGSYNPNLKMLFFRHNVLLKHPDYTLKADTLQYNTQTKTAYFFSYSEITDGKSTILCNYGNYNTQTGKSFFTKNAALLSKENIIRADTLMFDRKTNIGEAFGRLWVKDTSENIIIYGNRGYYDRSRRYTRVTGNPLARKIDNSDSTMIKANVFIYEDDSLAHRRTLTAFGNSKILSKEFAGTCDSLNYVLEDSLFKMFGKPVLWGEKTRLNADTVYIFLKNKKVNRMKMRQNSFVAILEDTGVYSQIKGKNMDNAFANNKLSSVYVSGDSRSIYYIKEKDSAISSVNVINSERMKIFFDSGKVEQVRFYETGQGNMYPIDQLPSDKQFIEGFKWDIENKPENRLFKPSFEVPELPSPKASRKETPNIKSKK